MSYLRTKIKNKDGVKLVMNFCHGEVVSGKGGEEEGRKARNRKSDSSCPDPSQIPEDNLKIR